MRIGFSRPDLTHFHSVLDPFGRCFLKGVIAISIKVYVFVAPLPLPRPSCTNRGELITRSPGGISGSLLIRPKDRRKENEVN